MVEGVVANSLAGPLVVGFAASATQADGDAANNAAVVEIDLLDSIFANGFDDEAP